MNAGNWNLNSMANYAGLLVRAAWFRRNWCRKNRHTISSVSSAIWARFRSTKHATSTRIWTWSIIPPKCSMFRCARQRKGSAVDRICPLWKFECGQRRQDKNFKCPDKICPSILSRQFQFCPLVRIDPIIVLLTSTKGNFSMGRTILFSRNRLFLE